MSAAFSSPPKALPSINAIARNNKRDGISPIRPARQRAWAEWKETFMSTTFTETISLTKLTCCSCQAVFALNTQFIERGRRDRGQFHGPHCQQVQGWYESENDRLKRDLEQKNRELTAARCIQLATEQLRDTEKCAKEAAEKKLRRVSAGVCPCCNRTFQNLARHMACKHVTKP